MNSNEVSTSGSCNVTVSSAMATGMHRMSIPIHQPWTMHEAALQEFEPGFQLMREQPEEQMREVVAPRAAFSIPLSTSTSVTPARSINCLYECVPFDDLAM
jgi:hypothetical protein